MIKHSKPAGKLQKNRYENSSNRGSAQGKAPVRATCEKQVTMRALLYLLFLACLVLLRFCLDLVRWPISRFQPALLSVRQGFVLAVGNGGKSTNEG